VRVPVVRGSLASGLLEQRWAVVIAEMGCEQPQAGQVHPTLAQLPEHLRIGPRGAGDQDAVVLAVSLRSTGGGSALGGVLGEAELPGAECEHRRVRTLEVELALIDFADEKEELRLEGATRLDDRTCAIQEVVVGELEEVVPVDRHARDVARPSFSPSSGTSERVTGLALELRQMRPASFAGPRNRRTAGAPRSRAVGAGTRLEISSSRIVMS